MFCNSDSTYGISSYSYDRDITHQVQIHNVLNYGESSHLPLFSKLFTIQMRNSYSQELCEAEESGSTRELLFSARLVQLQPPKLGPISKKESSPESIIELPTTRVVYNVHRKFKEFRKMGEPYRLYNTACSNHVVF